MKANDNPDSKGLPRALLGSLALSIACTPTLDPASKIEGFRLLALRSEPPEIAAPAPEGVASGPYRRPPAFAGLSSLVADPEYFGNPRKQSTVLYFACTPDPKDPLAGKCASLEALGDPGPLVRGSAGDASRCAQAGDPGNAPAASWGVGVVGGVSFSGLEVCDASGCAAARVQLDARDPATEIVLPTPVYALPPDFSLDDLEAGAPARTLGVVISVLGFAIDAAPEELVRGSEPCVALAEVPQRMEELLKTRAQVSAVKRIVVRGPDSIDPPNENPVIVGLTSETDALPSTVRVNAVVTLLPQLPTGQDGAQVPADSLFQSYTRYDSAGLALGPANEKWAYSWFATAGSFVLEHTWSDPVKVQEWTAPAGTAKDPLPMSGVVRLYVVARDLRGGIAWAMREIETTP